MQLSDEAIKEFQRLVFEEYGDEISFEEARKVGTNLVNLYEAVYTDNYKSSKPPESLNKSDMKG